MLLSNSRYKNGRRFEADTQGVVRCKGIREREIGAAVGVVEHMIEAGDRLDLLAHRYYNDARLWYRILDANPDLANGVEVSLSQRVGEVILIPKAKG
ncbi:tail protein X [Desulfobulbus rhabdoformis]|uniref:LysM peptidoglycan-binding domain-containing protein n=1 Tax=Desulfobulbus rhabdoformis TaxID=34032 RepID=UPI001964E16F|nr:tail protein X [Desulfobulbus rhabdoformis]MBM9613168.1 tail protein X [Desulfobulbus rhabdoformis]